MAKGLNSTTVLILDDEPEYFQWVEDFFESKKLNVKFVTTLNAAIEALSKEDFRLMLVDMNVPTGGFDTKNLLPRIPLISKYPGLALALEARSLGYGAHSVIAYTVHDDNAADRELAKLHCRYVLKGRPQVLKKVVEASLAPKPR